jgi:hypothetical protein
MPQPAGLKGPRTGALTASVRPAARHRGLLRGQHARSLAQIARRLRCAHYFGRGTGQKERAEQQGHLAAAERHTNRYDREAECEPVGAPLKCQLQEQQSHRKQAVTENDPGVLQAAGSPAAEYEQCRGHYAGRHRPACPPAYGRDRDAAGKKMRKDDKIECPNSRRRRKRAPGKEGEKTSESETLG